MPPVAPAKASSRRAFVVRQPIVDRTRKPFGYELLVESDAAADANAAAIERTTARVMSDALVGVGLDALASGRPAFVTISRSILLEGIPEVLPSKQVVLQLAGDIEADSDVIDACTKLRAKGYQFAIDDFVLNPWTEGLVPLAKFLKVRATALDDQTRADAVKAVKNGGPLLIVTGVDTPEAFSALPAAGCAYVQGMFLGEPVVRAGRVAVGQQQVVYLRLLRALNNPDLSVPALEDLVKHDGPLCHRILQTVNSAAFAQRTAVRSIRDALLLMGRDTVRRWASLWAMAGMNDRAHPELVAMATVRARCCEMLAGHAGDEHAADGFFLGLCSLLDAILERPMTEVVAELPLAEATKNALLGVDGPGRTLLDCVIFYERGKWAESMKAANRLGVARGRLPEAYAEALRWSRELEQQRAAK